MRFLFLVLFAAALAACQYSEPLAQARGPLFALNPGLWRPTPGDLDHVPPMGPHR